PLPTPRGREFFSSAGYPFGGSPPYSCGTILNMSVTAGLARPQAGSIPIQPGVYLFKDAAGRVIYAGKAKSLRARLANYFGSDLHPRTEAMVEAAADLEWIVTDNEVE